MRNQYNLYNFEALFKQFLIAGIENAQISNVTITSDKDNKDKTEKKPLKNVSIKNYLSDLRHFLGWLIFYLKSRNFNLSKPGETLSESLSDDKINILKKVDLKVIDEYKTYLIENDIPIKTINRRLSTLRKFFSFCISQGWLNENPAKKIENLKIKTKNEDWSFQKKSILNQFQTDLLKENIPQKTVNNFVNDIEEFLNSL